MSAECWYILSTDWLTDWLPSLWVRLIVLTWECDSTTSWSRHPQLLSVTWMGHESPPKGAAFFVCLFVSNTFVHPVIHLLLRWALLPNAPSSNDSFTVVLTYLSGYSVNGRCTGKKTKKVQNRTTSRRKTGQIELLSTPSRPPMDLWLLSQKHLALWSSLLMAFKMVFGTALPLGKPREFTLE